MADFFQNGVITTLHRLTAQRYEDLEARLLRHALVKPVALILPCLVRELDGPALPGIVKHLAKVRFIDEIVVALGRATRDDVDRARTFFAPLGPRCQILWIEGPRLQEIIRCFARQELGIGPPGKGRATWLAVGYLLGTGKSEVFALHDCDVLTYERSLVARLCYPLVDPSLGYEYAKGYYSRISDRLNGRVTRLFVTPLIRALQKLVGPVPFLGYLDSFRYVLAGEFAMSADLARAVRIPGDWGLEVGMLAEVYHRTSPRNVCQVDIADNYDHKHQPLSPDNPDAGLNRMARDIARSLLRTLAMEGTVFGHGFYTSLKVAYLRTAQEAIQAYSDDAAINGLSFDRHEESLAVEVFSRSLEAASEDFEADPLLTAGLPNWNRVISALPEILPRYVEAVDADAR